MLLATPCTIHLKREYPLEMEMPQPPWNQIHGLIPKEVDSSVLFTPESLLHPVNLGKNYDYIRNSGPEMRLSLLNIFTDYPYAYAPACLPPA